MTDVSGTASTTLVHLAGPLIRYETVQRQRCLWCGFVLVDDDLAMIAVQIPPCRYCGVRFSDEVAGQMCNGADDGPHFFPKPEPPGGWEAGAFVEVTLAGGFRGGSVVESEPSEDPEAGPDAVKVPDNCCMRLPAELTGREA